MTKWVLTILLAFSTLISFSAMGAESFNPVFANKTLDKLSIKLSTQELDVKNLEDAVGVLSDLQKQARECVSQSKDELENVNKQLKAIGQTTTKTEEQKYLENKKKELELLMSECRLFDIRASETVKAFTVTIQSQLTNELLTKEAPVWKNIAESPRLISALGKSFSLNNFVERSGYQSISFGIFSIAILLGLFGVLLGWYARRVLGNPIGHEPSEDLTTQLKYDLYSVLYRYFIYTIPTLIVTSYAYFVFYAQSPIPYILVFALLCSAYQLFMMALRFFVCPPNNKFSINKLPDAFARRLVGQFRLLAITVVFAYMLYVIINDQSLPAQFYYLLETLFILIFSSHLLFIVWQINKLPALVYKYRGLRWLISVVLAATLLGIVTAEVLGYHNVSEHVLISILLSVLLFIVIWFVNILVTHAIESLREGKSPWQQRFHYHLGMRKNETLTELIWLQVVLYIVVWGSFLGLLLDIWGLSEADDRLIYNLIVYGFAIGDYHVVPGKIIVALLFFTFFVLATRFVRGYFLRHTKIVRDTSARFALSTIVGYIGFMAAVVISLLIAGVDFTGIAIIAGALSVGVGFGLQNIVSNFLSGLILLVERPIKLGDRIIVGTTEGYVRKISIRSTRIRTQDRIDVIVPNSELISQQVTNLMFSDRLLRITIPVGVAYGSDTELVRKLLVEVAKEHPDVTDQEGHRPKALFRAFGNSTLDFELWAVLQDANKLNDVPSELHFAIDKKFRENNVEIAFPQQDIYIKEIPKDLKK